MVVILEQMGVEQGVPAVLTFQYKLMTSIMMSRIKFLIIMIG